MLWCLRLGGREEKTEGGGAEKTEDSGEIVPSEETFKRNRDCEELFVVKDRHGQINAA